MTRTDRSHGACTNALGGDNPPSAYAKNRFAVVLKYVSRVILAVTRRRRCVVCVCVLFGDHNDDDCDDDGDDDDDADAFGRNGSVVDSYLRAPP